MTKAELEFHAQAYDQHVGEARHAFAAGDLAAAVRSALKACESAEGRMRYQKKYEPSKLTFPTSFRYACHVAAILIDPTPIGAVAEILRDSRWIKKNCPEESGELVEEERERLLRIYAAWLDFAGRPYVAEDEVAARWGRDASVKGAIDNWIRFGFVTAESGGGKTYYVVNGRTSEKVLAKCPACGVTTIGAQILFLEPANCPKCKGVVDFVITSRAPFKGD